MSNGPGPARASLQVPVTGDLLRRLRLAADRQEVPLAAAARVALDRGLRATDSTHAELAAIAALVAAEHGLLLLQRIVPQGESVSGALLAPAAVAAEARLARLQAELERGG